MKAVRTKIGTWPVGSEWTKIEAPKDGPLPAWGIKDLVQGPTNLKLGNYVISFRWEAKQLHKFGPLVQIWFWNFPNSLHILSTKYGVSSFNLI